MSATASRWFRSFASMSGATFGTVPIRDWGILMPHLQAEREREYRTDPRRIGGGLSALLTGGRSGFVYVERLVGKSGLTQTNVALGFAAGSDRAEAGQPWRVRPCGAGVTPALRGKVCGSIGGSTG